MALHQYNYGVEIATFCSVPIDIYSAAPLASDSYDYSLQPPT